MAEGPGSTQEVGERGGRGRRTSNSKMMLAIASVAVAALLVGSLAYVLVTNDDDGIPGLEAVIDPDPAEVPAGLSITLVVSLFLDDSPFVDEVDATVEWSVEPSWLGSFTTTSTWNSSFHAGDVTGEGVIICDVVADGEDCSGTADVLVLPAILEQVTVTPDDVLVLLNETQEFEAVAWDSTGSPMTSVTFEWDVSGMDEASYELTADSGPTVGFWAKAVGNATLDVVATSGDRCASAQAEAEIVKRTVTYRWYDMFNVPFGDWWTYRWERYHNQQQLTDSYPYLYRSYSRYPYPGNETTIHASMRLHVTASGIDTVNMEENPLFLPMFGPERGGHAEIEWYLQYNTSYPYGYIDKNLQKRSALCFVTDGWMVQLTGTTTLDRQAALAVLNITSDEFDDFEAWWELNDLNYSMKYGKWIENEGRNDSRYDIYNMYSYALTNVRFELDAQKVGNGIVLTYNHLSWGMEALMTRWLRSAFMPTEWYFEDFNLHAVIGPKFANIEIETVVINAVSATASLADGGPSWVWQGFLQDYEPSTLPHPSSDFDPYELLNYTDRYAGSGTNGRIIRYDYTPGSFNLTEGETLIFEWPDGDQLFLDHGGTGFWNTTNVSGPMSVSYVEPMPDDLPGGKCVIDDVARTITFTGPIDFWTWSRDQTAHGFLASEWTRLGLMPYGMPFIEFSMGAGAAGQAVSLAEPPADEGAALGPDSDAGSDAVHEYGAEPIEFQSRDEIAIETRAA